jgi:hypothetical protein
MLMGSGGAAEQAGNEGLQALGVLKNLASLRHGAQLAALDPFNKFQLLPKSVGL